MNWSLFISAHLKEEEIFKIISMKVSVLYVSSVRGACILNTAETSYQRALFKDRIRSLLVAQSCLTPWEPMDWSPPGSSVHGLIQAGILECCHSLLQGIFSTQGLNLGLLHCRRILYHLSHQGSTRESPQGDLILTSPYATVAQPGVHHDEKFHLSSKPIVFLHDPDVHSILYHKTSSYRLFQIFSRKLNRWF